MEDVSGGHRLQVDDPVIVRTAARLREDLLNALREHDDVVLELGPDAAADLCGVQVIESARIYAVGKAKRFALARPASGALFQALQAGGCLEAMSDERRQFWLGGRPS